MFDQKNNVIVTGATNLQIWPMRRNFSQFKKSYKGHQEPLVSALYDEKFKQVVSADSSNVIVWNAENGELIFRFTVVSAPSFPKDKSKKKHQSSIK